MSEIQIWHNPRCSKSREAMKLLEENGVEVEVVNYLEADLDEATIKELLLKLDIDAVDLIRTGEDIYKELKLEKVGDEGVLIRAMSRFPKLIQRPIVIKGNKAVIGRPAEKIMEFLKS
ncbi:MAG: arsenate reductase (glutaredoxin) [Helicobacteraceae bacterium]|jgi:arsenate reductase|nr:arsenate reductase (glutaredoxin) [Helicobacteraceae bacterium]